MVVLFLVIYIISVMLNYFVGFVIEATFCPEVFFRALAMFNALIVFKTGRIML